MKNELKIFTGSSNPELAGEICSYLGVNLGKSNIIKFSNENIKVKLDENVRGADVFVIQTSCPPVNEGIIELLIMIDALKHSSADRITAVLPYFPYVRSDKKDEPRISITARLMADLLAVAGADRVITMNLHSPQIQGFFRIPVDHLLALPLFVDYFTRTGLDNHVVVAPDAGSAKRAGVYASRLDLPLAIMDKRRRADDEKAEVMNIIGQVEGKDAIVFDDEIATGGSLMETIRSLKAVGAGTIRAAAVHGVLSADAVDRIAQSVADEVIVTNTIPVRQEKRIEKIKVLSVASMFGEAIRRIHHGESVSALFV